MLSPYQFAQMSPHQRMLEGLKSLGMASGRGAVPTRDALDVRQDGARVNMLAMPSWQKSMMNSTLNRAAIVPMRSDAPVNLRGLSADLPAFETAKLTLPNLALRRADMVPSISVMTAAGPSQAKPSDAAPMTTEATGPALVSTKAAATADNSTLYIALALGGVAALGGLVYLATR